MSISMRLISPGWLASNKEYSNLAVLKKLWEVIAIYSNYQKFDIEEFSYSVGTIDSISYDSDRYYFKVFSSRVLCLYCDSLLDFSAAKDGGYYSFKKMKQVFISLYYWNQTKVQVIRQYLSDCLKANFKIIDQKINELVDLYKTKATEFPIQALRLESLLAKFLEKLLLLYGFSKNPDAKSIYNREMREQMTQFLIRFSFSPVLYMIGADNMDGLLGLANTNATSDYQSSLTNHILDYTDKVIDLQEFINQNIPDDASLAEFFFTKIKPFSPQELCSKDQMKYPYKDSYMADIKNTFTLQSKLFPVVYLDATSLQSLTYEPLRVDNITLIMSTILNNLSTTVDFILLNLKYKFKQGHEEAPECDLKLQITPFEDRFISSYYTVPEVQEYVYKKSRMILRHFIQNSSVTNIEEKEESFMRKLCAMTAWQEFVENITREQMLDLFENGQDVQEFLKTSCNFVHLFSEIISGHILNSKTSTFDTAKPCINIGSRWIKSEKDLKWYTQQGQKAIKRHFELISRLLNSQVDPELPIKDRKLLKNKQVVASERSEKHSSPTARYI